MKRLSTLLALALTASLLAAPAALAQPKTTPAPAPAPAAQPDKTPAKPTDKPADKTKDEKPKADKPKAMEDKAGPNHKMLEQFEGEWAAETKNVTPGEESTQKGTMTIKMVYGARFMSMDFDGRDNRGQFFRGGGLMGYNNAEKRFEATWADSMGTGIMFMTGSASGDGKIFTLTGDAIDPATSKKATWKEVITVTSKESWRDDFYVVIDGKESKKMEITYTKAAKGEKKDDAKKDDAAKKEEKPKK